MLGQTLVRNGEPVIYCCCVQLLKFLLTIFYIVIHNKNELVGDDFFFVVSFCWWVSRLSLVFWLEYKKKTFFLKKNPFHNNRHLLMTEQDITTRKTAKKMQSNNFWRLKIAISTCFLVLYCALSLLLAKKKFTLYIRLSYMKKQTCTYKKKVVDETAKQRRYQHVDVFYELYRQWHASQMPCMCVWFLK